MVIASEETVEKSNNAFSSEHCAPGLSVCAALVCDNVLELVQGLLGEEMCFLLSFTIETWHLRAQTLLAEQLSSIRWSRWEPNSATKAYCRQRSVYLPPQANRFILTQ